MGFDYYETFHNLYRAEVLEHQRCRRVYLTKLAKLRTFCEGPSNYQIAPPLQNGNHPNVRIYRESHQEQ